MATSHVAERGRHRATRKDDLVAGESAPGEPRELGPDLDGPRTLLAGSGSWSPVRRG